MTTFVLVHGAWHGPWAWERVAPLLHAAGAHTLTPDLSSVGDYGLHDHAAIVAATLDTAPDDELVLVGHSYSGLVVREAADLRPDAVGHIVLVDGWAGADGASMFSLAPDPFAQAIRAAAEARGDGWQIPAPPPAAFGIVDTDHADRLAARLLPSRCIRSPRPPISVVRSIGFPAPPSTAGHRPTRSNNSAQPSATRRSPWTARTM
ncbi:alpha/beta fold hydrolase [Nocardia exalbida]|uniref:alpha/beta fold hydrolase n=1 Tax=Nocardia exalbida TaxID=290231 RepID=UPI000302748C|nr:alpha/beta fold hydrolase [Nocardia exalbida]